MNGKTRAFWAALTAQSRKGAADLTASASCGTEHPQLLNCVKPTHNMNNPHMLGNKNKSENVRGKLSMSPSFPHHSLRETAATLIF